MTHQETLQALNEIAKEGGIDMLTKWKIQDLITKHSVAEYNRGWFEAKTFWV